MFPVGATTAQPKRSDKPVLKGLLTVKRNTGGRFADLGTDGFVQNLWGMGSCSPYWVLLRGVNCLAKYNKSFGLKTNRFGFVFLKDGSEGMQSSVRIGRWTPAFPSLSRKGEGEVFICSLSFRL